MIERLFEAVGSLGGPWAYLAVGALAAGESSIGLGLVVPGETGLIVGGFVVSQGNADFTTMVLVGIAGAIVGNSIGYEIGRRLGPSVRTSRFGRRVGDRNWGRAERFLATRGAKAVAITQFLAVLRSVAPALAGVAGMPYRTFLLWNAVGSVLWGFTFVTIGYFAGRSYERVADTIESAGLVLLGLVVLVLGVVLAARWAARHPERVHEIRERLVGSGTAEWLRRNLDAPVRFVQARFRVGDPLGLRLTLGLGFVIAGGWALAALVGAVSGRGDLVRVDRPTTEYVAGHRVDWLDEVMRAVTGLGAVEVLAPLLGLVALAWMARGRRWGIALFLLLAFGGAALAGDVLKELVGRPRPPDALAVASASGMAFPSGHVTQATVAYGALAYVHSPLVRLWAAKVALWAGALVVVVLVAASRVYLGVHWLTDVVGGMALGATWLGIVAVTYGTGRRVAGNAWGLPVPRERLGADGGAPPAAAPDDGGASGDSAREDDPAGDVAGARSRLSGRPTGI